MTMSEQQNWRWCNKCKSVHYMLAVGVCPGGGAHDSSTSTWYAIPTTAPEGVTSQPGWRKCKKCQVLFYSLLANTCAAGGAHDPTGSLECWLATSSYPANGGQEGWRWCDKCQQILQPYQGAGSCPAGGNHNHAGEYRMKLGYPDPSQNTATFGGPGGNSFNDSEVLSPSANTGPLRQIFIRAGVIVDSIGIGYANGMRFNHGTSTGGTEQTITLAADEFITSVQGRAGSSLDQITFISNKTTYGPYGGGGGNPFSVNFWGCALQYIFGRAGQYVDQIGFGYGKPLNSLSNTISRSNTVGGTGGYPFDDVSENGALLGKISSITLRHGTVIDNLSVKYKGGANPSHGGGGGTAVEFALDDDEWITEIRGRAGTQLDAVQFVLSSGRTSPIYGGPGGNPFSLKKEGCVVAGFFGRADKLVDQLGVCFDDAKPKKVTISSITFDLDNFQISETPKALTSNVVMNRTTRDQTTSSTLTDEVSESETLSLQVTNGHNIEMGYEAEFAAFGIKNKVTVKYGYSFQTAKTTEHTTSKTRTISHQVSTVVAPNTSVKVTARVTEGTYDVPWTAQGRVTYIDGTQSQVITLHGKLKGVQCYGQAVVYEEV